MASTVPAGGLCSNCNSKVIGPGIPSLDVPVFESWGRTQMQIVKFKFTWTIQNFSFFNEETGDEIVSPIFLVGPNEELKWQVEAYPKGDCDESKDYLSLFLTLVSAHNQTAVTSDYKLSILNSRGEIIKSLDATDKFVRGSNSSWGFSKFIKLADIIKKDSGFLPNDILIILCEGTAAVNKINTSGLSGGPQIQFPESSLAQDFGSLFENAEFSDVTLAVDGHNLFVHKVVLAARSPVFAAMFKCEMNESKQNLVVIVDIEYKVVKEMLTYIYTGKSPNLATMTEELLVAADKYDLAVLKKMCETVLFSSLTVENAVDLLVLADMYCASQLKAQVIQFITNHVKDVMLTPAWKNRKLTHSQIIIDVFEALASHTPPPVNLK